MLFTTFSSRFVEEGSEMKKKNGRRNKGKRINTLRGRGKEEKKKEKTEPTTNNYKGSQLDENSHYD